MGRLHIGSREEIFRLCAQMTNAAAEKSVDSVSIGLTGGSTPLAFYRWAVAERPFSPALLEKAVWTVSDERMVPLTDGESNFGNADRELLQPMGIGEEKKMPFPVEVDPHSAATVFERKFLECFGRVGFDICVLGMGDDGHTASIFPESPLLALESGELFAPVEVPGKGWRLSVTPLGLELSKRIVVLVTGAGKAERLAAVFGEEPGHYPIQILARFADRVDWLVDEAAAGKLAGDGP